MEIRVKHIDKYAAIGHNICEFYKILDEPCPIEWDEELNGWVNIEDSELGYDKALTLDQLKEMFQILLDSLDL